MGRFLKTRLSLINQSDISRFVFWVSVIMLGGFIGKLVFWNKLILLAHAWNNTTLGTLIEIHFTPNEIPIWQLAIVCNSGIAIFLYLFIRSSLQRIDLDVPRSPEKVEKALAIGFFVRSLFTTYTMLCLFYLYMRAVADWNLPPIGTKLFPWQ